MRDRSRDRRGRDWRHRQGRKQSPPARRRRSPSPVIRRDKSRDRGIRKSSPVASSYRNRRDSPDRSTNKKRGREGPRGGNLRIDRHECRKAAIEFLINHYDLPQQIPDLDELINTHIRSLDMDFDYYGFTVEILKGLLEDRKYTVIADRWIMGILDEHLQAELRVPDLSILRVAGYELLTHPEIPTTVVINEVNVLAKMYCPERQSLIHAAVNRMIETQISIGNEIAAESGCLAKPGGAEKPNDPMAALVGLDQQAQLAIILLEQKRKSRKQKRQTEHSPVSSEDATDEPSDIEEEPMSHAKPVEVSESMDISQADVRKPHIGPAPVLKINYAPVLTPMKIRVHAGTQTVRDPTMEPGVRVYRIIR